MQHDVRTEEIDRDRLRALGISEDAIGEQVERLRAGTRFARLDRPAVRGDGIRVVDSAEADALVSVFETHRDNLALAKFVPASGAASRMFQELIDARKSLRGEAAESPVLDTFVRGVAERRFALCSALERELERRGRDVRAPGTLALLDVLLAEMGLDYASLAKGLIPFHRYGDTTRTAVEEHVAEAVAYASSTEGRGLLHFTVPPTDRARFEQLLAASLPVDGRLLEVGLSEQEHRTDTVALCEDGGLVRDDSGGLALRPGGHGALLDNLQNVAGDIVFIKNIDNVQHQDHAQPTIRYKKVIGGLLAQIRERVFALQAQLDADAGAGADAATLAAAREYLREQFGCDPSGLEAAQLRGSLFRPIRVCGMVPNQGEPGGGPFWVIGDDGVSLQIVESAQVDADDPAQTAIAARATHFNPVDLACCFKDYQGRPYRLADFVDDSMCFVAHKSYRGQTIRALELPGLWNGAMARWNTVFVEVPIETFSPVKTVNDLLRDAHQP